MPMIFHWKKMFIIWSYDGFVHAWTDIDQKLTLCPSVQMVACARERKKCEEVSILMTILTRDWVENQTDSCQKCIPTRILEIHTHIKLNLNNILPYVCFGLQAQNLSVYAHLEGPKLTLPRVNDNELNI